MRIAILVTSLMLTGCAVGIVQQHPKCEAKGFAVGRGYIHVTCDFKDQDFFVNEEVIEQEVPPLGDNDRIPAPGEMYIEISGASPSSGFWGFIGEMAAWAASAAAAYFGFGG